jgi:alkylhydroperoxidase family enzyme
MSRMNVYHDRNSPAAARVTLTRMKNFLGNVPDLSGVLAGAPGVLDACTEYTYHFMQGSLDQGERYLILFVASREFGNEYCNELVKELSLLNKQAARMVEALNKRRKLTKKAHRALADFVAAVVQKGGAIGDDEYEQVRKAGYSEQQVLEIIMGISIAWIWSNVSGVAGLSAEK